MIIDFSVENFRSIKEMQTLSMSAANIVSKFKDTDEHNLIDVSDKLSLLKTKAIYGANASGKSNLVKALLTFISIISKSVKDDKILKQIDPYRLSTETEFKPSYFQISFLLNGIYYRYGFEATRTEVESEWLFGTPGKKEVPFFVRKGKIFEINEKQFKEGIKINTLYSQDGNDMARDNSLFLTVVKSFSNGIAKNIIDYIESILIVSGLSNIYLSKMAEDSLDDDENRKRIIELMKISDTGIHDISKYEYENKDNPDKKNKVALTEHKKYDAELKEIGSVKFWMSLDESEGTRKMFEVSPFILKALNESTVLIMDEFDARFHPLLTKKIVELFNSEANRSTQLIFVTHDTNLLNPQLLRRDQICFAEKDRYGASHFYSLVDFKGVRNDASFEKDYIAGRYGAIPFIGDFTSIIHE